MQMMQIMNSASVVSDTRRQCINEADEKVYPMKERYIRALRQFFLNWSIQQMFAGAAENTEPQGI